MIGIASRVRRWLFPCDCWCCHETAAPGEWMQRMEFSTIPRQAEDGGLTFLQEKVAPGERECPGGPQAHEPWWVPDEGCPWCKGRV